MQSLFKNSFTSFIFSNVTESSLPLAVAAHLHKLNSAQLGNSFFAHVALNSQISLKIYETEFLLNNENENQPGNTEIIKPKPIKEWNKSVYQ